MKKSVELASQGKINKDASIRDSQSIIINAPIKEVWKILSDIKSWPEWNKDIKSVEINSFEVGGHFKWKQNGIKISSTLRKVQGPEMICWTGSVFGIKAIHTWKLEPTEENQTIATTSESMQGVLALLFFSNQKLHNALINWLSRLKEHAEK